jgi:hypothetical protein
MSYSISTLLLRNLSDVFGGTTPCGPQSTRSFTKTQYSMTAKGGVFRGREVPPAGLSLTLSERP